MFGWTFPARTVDEVARLLAAMQKHRYLKEVDLRLHWIVDRALVDHYPAFAEQRERFKVLRNVNEDLDIESRDTRLWRISNLDEVVQVLTIFWEPGERGDAARSALVSELRAADFPTASEDPFCGSVEEPAHPELVMLDWVLLPVDELDIDRHKGALAAMEDSGDEAEASAPIYVEGPTLGEAELCRGAPSGALPCDLTFWADGPYSYADYVFRGVGRAARLAEPPQGYRDVDKA